MKLNRKLVLVLALLVSIAMATTGTLAYLTDTDEAVNVMTLGNVMIEQHEKDADGNPFAQAQPLYPAYDNVTPVVGAIDKFVTVENTGSSDAYVRTWIAFEMGGLTEERFNEIIKITYGGTGYTLDEKGSVEIGGVNYYVVCATYNEKLAPGKTTDPSLKQVYMTSKGDNDDVAKLGETYEILVYTQACQTANLEQLGAKDALIAAFGNDQPWGDSVQGLPTTTVKTAAELKEALEKGGIVVLANDVTLDADETIAVGSKAATTFARTATPATARLDLAGHTITATSNGTGSNRNVFTVKNATLTVNNGTINYNHTGDNMAWNNSTNIFHVENGELNLNGVTAKNLGGSDMAFVAHLNNWGEVTLNVNNSTLESSYAAVRLFNSGYDMNNVSIYNSTLAASNMAFWVHNYTASDFGDDTEKAAAAAARLNLDFENGTNNIYGKIRYGFTIKDDDLQPTTPAAVATNADELIEALEKSSGVYLFNDVQIDPAGMSNAYGTTGINVKNGQTIDGNGNTLDIKGAGGTWDSGINTTGGLIKNITVTGSFRGIFINHNSSHAEKVVLENVIIDGTVYTISCDQGTNNGLEATNSTFNGWTSYASTLGDAKFVDCSFGEGSGYAYCRPYAPTEFVGCDFEAGYKMDARAAVTFENCTIGGEALTADNLATLVTSNTANATIK